MNELNIYQRLLTLSIAHTNATEFRELHGFGVGFLYMLNQDAFDQGWFQKSLFYSEQWFQGGKDPAKLKLDFPFMLLVPPKGRGNIDRHGFQNTYKDKDFDLELYLFDLFGNDRNNNPDSVYAKRSREEIWNDLTGIFEGIFQQFGIFTPGGSENFLILEKGRYTEERDLYEWGTFSLIGIRHNVSLRIKTTCDVGSFDFTKQYPAPKSALSKKKVIG